MSLISSSHYSFFKKIISLSLLSQSATETFLQTLCILKTVLYVYFSSVYCRVFSSLSFPIPCHTQFRATLCLKNSRFVSNRCSQSKCTITAVRKPYLVICSAAQFCSSLHPWIRSGCSHH